MIKRNCFSLCLRILYVFFLLCIVGLTSSVRAEDVYQTKELRDVQRKGELLLQNKQFTDALQIFTDLHQHMPEDATIKQNLLLAYNGHGVNQINEGDCLGAIYYLKKALVLSDDPSVINENLSVAYFRLAQQQENKGELMNSIQSFKKALEFNPTLVHANDKLGMIFYNHGAQYYKKRDYAKAEEFLLEALNYRANSNVYVYQVLGEIAYYQQKLDDALAFWKKALEQSDITDEQRTVLGVRMLKLQKERKEEAGLASYRSDTFIIRYDKETLEESAYKINAILRSAYRVVGRYFNYFPKTKSTVIIFNADVFSKKTNDGHGGIRALYDGKIRLPSVDRNTDTETFKSLLWHEYTHALVYELAGHKCPTWLNEGLAQIQENSIIEIQTPELRNAIKHGKTIPFGDIFPAYNAINQNTDIHLFYQQAFSMTRFLVKRYQIYKVKKLLGEIKKGKPFELAFKDTFYLTAERFEKKWLDYVKTHS